MSSVSLASYPHEALDTRAQGYGALPWVNDLEWFSALLPDEILQAAPGVLDLGCGPARLASWLRGRAEIRYVGVDRHAVMLDQAKARLSVPARIIADDIETLTLPRFAGWIFVLANVLHYLEDLESLGSLPRRLGCPRLTCLAQTESASEETLAWAMQLFAIVRPGYRRRWHKPGDIDRLLEDLDAEILLDRIVCQRVDLDAWLDGWHVGDTTRRLARAHFDDATPAVRAPGARRTMVRRQRILHFRF